MSNIKNLRDYEAQAAEGDEPSSDLTSYVDVLIRYRWTFLAVAAAVMAVGLLFALLSKPVYRADILVQVEDQNSGNVNNTNKPTATVSPVYDARPAPSTEIELLRSRMVVGKAVDALQLDISASPNYFPVIGGAVAGFNRELSQPGLFGRGGYAWGGEAITVSRLEVPPAMERRLITVTALGNDTYRLAFASDAAVAEGRVGVPLTVATHSGKVTLEISQLEGRPGAVFHVSRVPRAVAIADLQSKLMITERGKQSGVIGVALEGTSAEKTAAILNEIGNEYVEQNLRRKAAEAEKSLAFLEAQLPQLKQQLESAESRYNTMRNQRGTIDLNEESRLVLSQSVAAQTKLADLRQRRQELIARFTPNHPAIEIMDKQIADVNAEIGSVGNKIQRLPDIEQNVLRLMRDVRVSTEMYQSLLNDVQQLRLVKASKIGTARLVDPAEVPIRPVKPNRKLIAAASVLLGLLAGTAVVVLRRLFDGGVADADEIERETGMTVYATVPYSAAQSRLRGGPDIDKLLARRMPDDPAVESLRSFRTSLQFALLNSDSNNVVVITGPAPEVGKSFISANFATVLATAGRRVVLVDADLRRGGLNHHFGKPRVPGLTELLTGTPLEQVLQRDVVPGLDFIATGSEPPLAADLLQTRGMDTLLATLRNRYDVVLLDTPPVLATSDAGVLATKAGAVFLVARADASTASELKATRRAIVQAGSDIKGVIFNGLKVEGRWYRAHYHFGKYRYMNQYGGASSKRA
ncbi:polysaccharide biosynthesis tyrosine autokinase [Cupriavidus alkaliphilus]|uniref:polysaccharide biosynthesis tyrosine autokinase n=1 Tax=Cupriavidus alkaliphilus TaxID=942866 RepID=UPI001617D151|nr:polysaccharide biosynthesis tyrosine autokinase [Cupriavidus alkaliphilus]MBB3014727.1 tyrosine-protein kinase Etk/Wzc [Cupriavidus alkaliphilus]